MRKCLFVLVLLLMSASTIAQKLSEQEAKQRALAFLTQGSRAKGFSKGAARQLHTVKGEMTGLYAFNVDGGGFVIASGDSRTLPILGYSDHGSLDFNTMSDNLRFWLSSYETAIKELGDADDLGDQSEPVSVRPAVEPLITSKWYQVFPYNLLCPLFDGMLNSEWDGKHGATGCTATAMAMLMKFHEWPKTECKAIPAYSYEYSYNDVTDTIHYDALPPVAFDWDNMLDSYSEKPDSTNDSEASQYAVAQLMQYCAHALRTKFTPNGSGAQSLFIQRALIEYFNYDKNMRYVIHAFYGIDEWEDMVYAELAEGRPVYYGGSTDAGGHSFVCDGYDGNGLFHINWGWSGKDDGYFLLSVLNPYNNTSTGASKSRLGFCINQDAILGIMPATDGTSGSGMEPYFCLVDDLFFYEEDEELKLVVSAEWLKKSELYGELGLCSIDSDGKLREHYVSPQKLMQTIFEIPFYVPMRDIDLEEGVATRLYPVFRSQEAGAPEWQRLTTDAQYIEATRLDGKTNIVIKPDLHLEIVGVQLDKNPAKAGEDNFLSLQIKNNGEEFCGKLRVLAVYLDDEGMDKVEEYAVKEGYMDKMEVGAFLRAGQTSEVRLPFKPSQKGNVALLLARGNEEHVASYLINIPEATGITTLAVDGQGDTQWYDLRGIRISKPKCPGVYIRGRKLVTVK
ncbi:MAG: C10 family peptidase [Prevotella sp.]